MLYIVSGVGFVLVALDVHPLGVSSWHLVAWSLAAFAFGHLERAIIGARS